jgi:hypothetical protein
LDELLKSLNLRGEDIGGVFVPKEEVESLKEDTKWMAVMRVLTPRPFSATSMKKTMRFAWAPAQEVKFRDIEDNKFVIQASCLGDWQRITEQGPWIFREQGLLIEKFDGSCKASSVELNRIHAWVQIHDVPELFRKKPIMTDLAARIGDVITVDMRVDGADYVRARVWLDVRKELTRFVSIQPEGQPPVVMRVKFEKIPRFCAVCGFLGHTMEECGSGEHLPETLGFGKWMLADTPWNRSQLNAKDEPFAQNKAQGQGRGMGGWTAGNKDGRGRGGTGRGRDGGRGSIVAGRGRSGGRGHGGYQGHAGGHGNGQLTLGENRKRTSTDASLSEVSPPKGAQANIEVPRLEWKSPGEIAVSEGGKSEVAKKLDFEGEKEAKTYITRSGTPPPPPSAREQKRPKKHTTPRKDKNTSTTAGSSEEHRQDQ